MTSIIQWNLNSYKTKFYQLKKILYDFSPVCMCLQETLHGAGSLKPPSGYSIEVSTPNPDDQHDRGTAVLINKAIAYNRLPLNTDLQAVAIKLHLVQSYTVCSLYLPHSQITKRQLTDLISQLPPPYLLLGDMNARSRMWGDTTTNARGRIFEDILTENNISILNDGQFTHYHSQTNSHSIIDLAFCSPDILDELTLAVSENLCDSDHYPIYITIATNTQHYDRPIRYDTSRANWTTYKEITETNSQREHFHNINDFCSSIEELINNAAAATMPTTSGKLRRPPVPWWNGECQLAKIERNRAERAVKRNPNLANKIRYNRAKAQCRFTCNNERATSWKSYVSSINSHTNINQIWKRIKKISGKHAITATPALKLPESQEITSEHKTVADQLTTSFISVSNEQNYTRQFIEAKRTAERKQLNFNSVRSDTYNNSFTFEEFKRSLNMTSESSPGQDKITYKMIKMSHISLQMLILHLFNTIFSQGVFPDSWKISIVVPILKPGKDPNVTTSYRPISLTSCLCKLLEKMINDRLMWYLEINDRIPPQQAGFRRHRNTTDHLVELETTIQEAINRRQHTVAVFFDINKAYDTAWRYGVLRKLYDYGLRGSLPIFIKNFLTDRRITTRIGNTYSDEQRVSEGIPQGSVLSCTLFLVAVSDITDGLPVGVKCALYVDDLTIYACGALTNLIERRLQLAINRLVEWSNTNGMSFSKPKTVAMHFCRKHNCPKIINTLTLDNTPLLTVDTHKFLGITFDNSLTWREHIIALKKSSHKVLNILKHLSFKKWGADRETLLRLYVAMLKPKLDYGSESYSSACKTLLASIATIQNAAIRIATGAFKSSPIASLHSDAAIKPVEYYRDIKHLNYIAHKLAVPKHPLNETFARILDVAENNPEISTSKSFTNRCISLINTYDLNFNTILLETYPIRPPWLFIPPTTCTEMYRYTKKNFAPIELKHRFLEHARCHHNQLEIYTDGSAADGRAGSAFVGGNFVRTLSLPAYCSNFTAELTAIRGAAEYAQQQKMDTTVFTDSRSSIQAISKLYPTHPIVAEIQTILMSSDFHLTLCWVPAHTGVHLNEKADRAADEASRYPPQNITIPRDDFKAYIKKTVSSRWKREWHATENNKLREIKEHTSPLPNSSSRSRQWERTLTRLRIGHSHLTHGFLMEGGPPPYCNDCLVPLTVRHILVECPSYGAERMLAFGTAAPTLSSVLIDSAWSGGPLMKYLNDIQIYNLI